jgi:two-component system, chemotaxis family, CheB/CheR fusion protein
MKEEFAIHASNAGLVLRAAPCRLTVHSDPRFLEQILRNMLSNATKYTSRGKILLGCRRRGERLSIEVWDTGTGIPDTELSAIFREYHQLENHPGKRSGGLGLGLAIVQRLADLLEAPVTVRSRLGRGSVFAIEVPVVHALARGPVSAKVVDPSCADCIQDLSSERPHAILIVEDDAEIRDTLKLLFESRRYRVFAARDGPQALILMAERGVNLDLIVADYNLPGPNGLEVVANIKETSGRKIPAILLTGDISATTLREIAEQGHVHLYKPVNARTLMRHVKDILDTVNQRSTVFIIDDDRELREAMRLTLEMHGYRVESFADASSFLDAYSPDRAGCVITDARMPGIGGMQLIKHLHKIQPAPRVIMLTAYGDIAMAVTAMKAGAYDFLQKPVRQKDLLDCIERAVAHPDERSSQSEERELATVKIENLTPRQRQILNLVLAGSPSKNIAADLRISQRTVDNHRAAIMRKVGAKSLSALIRIALAAT